jgi:hypothetical protein
VIYVASSWRNERQPDVVTALLDAGLGVYDFKNPEPGDHGFHWSEIDPAWKSWTPQQYLRALDHRLARHGFATDMGALRRCRGCLLVLPCGRSAHLELGWACGAGKRTAILLDQVEPELMAKMVDLVTEDLAVIVDWARQVELAA